MCHKNLVPQPYCPSTHAFSRITNHTKAIAITNVMKKLRMHIMIAAPRYLYRDMFLPIVLAELGWQGAGAMRDGKTAVFPPIVYTPANSPIVYLICLRLHVICAVATRPFSPNHTPVAPIYHGVHCSGLEGQIVGLAQFHLNWGKRLATLSPLIGLLGTK